MNKTKKYSGVIVPMITPLKEDYSVDIPSAIKISDRFIAAEVDVFLLGTTGESVSNSNKQRAILVEEVSKHIHGRIKIYAGVSGHSLEDTINEAQAYSRWGIDAIVAHLPYKYPLIPEQMQRYFNQLAKETSLPLIIYNNPVTIKQSIPLPVIESLSSISNIVGVKDSERGIERLNESLKKWAYREDFSYLLGWAAQSTYALSKGADGIVPSTGNLIPALYKKLFETAINGNIEEANNLQQLTNEISEIYQKNKNISQSIPGLKLMMAEFGYCSSTVLPPLYELDMQESKFIKGAIRQKINEIKNMVE
jgi:4-hydroxy-tetrahydrodipicolinate synthase